MNTISQLPGVLIRVGLGIHQLLRRIRIMERRAIRLVLRPRQTLLPFVVLHALMSLLLASLVGCDEPVPAAPLEPPQAAIQRIGGRIKVDPTKPERPVIEVDLCGVNATEDVMARVAEFRELRWLLLSDAQVSPASLRHVAQLQKLEVLSLSGTAITDDSLAHIAQLPRLRILFVGRTRVTDDGLTYLAKLRALEDLDLSGLQVSDVGISRLASLEHLRLLHVEETRVSDRGVETLHATLPKCLVLR